MLLLVVLVLYIIIVKDFLTRRLLRGLHLRMCNGSKTSYEEVHFLRRMNWKLLLWFTVQPGTGTLAPNSQSEKCYGHAEKS